MPSPPADATEVTTADGSLTLWRPRPDIVYCKMRGHMGDLHWRAILKICQSVVDEGHRLSSFLDWQEMTGYDAAARTELTIWSLDNKKNVEMAHILVKHKVVAMGVSVAGALVRNLKAYTDANEFEAALMNAERAHAGASKKDA